MVTKQRVKRTAELQRFPGNQEATLERARTQALLDPTLLKRLDVGTLILWGRKDRWVPVADAIHFKSDIKGSRLQIFDCLGHDPMEEDPRASAAVGIGLSAADRRSCRVALTISRGVGS